MNRSTGILLTLGLCALYSLALIGWEASTSQASVRHFVTDITGPVPFYAVNTTLSVTLLWGAGLLYLACSSIARSRGDRRASLFFLSQSVVFAWLGCDDRFQFHETLGRWFGMADHYFLVPVAFVQAVLLVAYGRQYLPVIAWRSIGAASVFFAVMFAVDAFAPHDAWLRLSVEDTAKTWACLCFLLAAWWTLMERFASSSPISSPGVMAR